VDPLKENCIQSKTVFHLYILGHFLTLLNRISGTRRRRKRPAAARVRRRRTGGERGRESGKRRMPKKKRRANKYMTVT
jgi:hypothetical protein